MEAEASSGGGISGEVGVSGSYLSLSYSEHKRQTIRLTRISETIRSMFRIEMVSQTDSTGVVEGFDQAVSTEPFVLRGLSKEDSYRRPGVSNPVELHFDLMIVPLMGLQ